MTTLQYIAAAAAVSLVAGPWARAACQAAVERLVSDDGDHKPARLSGPTFQQAISSLAGVRQRLSVTGCLNADQKAAIDVLTLALVEGSDK